VRAVVLVAAMSLLVGAGGLGVAPGPAFARGLRRRALQLCPARIVERSWAVSLSLERVQLPASARVVFLAKASKGWTAWYHS